MERTKIKTLLSSGEIGKSVCVKGWVRSFRNNQFIAINDGSTIKTIQAVAGLDDFEETLRRKINVGAAIGVIGQLVESKGRGQSVEIHATEITIYGEADPEKYPLQPKKHSMEFLREISHLRFRTNTFGAVFRIRHAAAFAIHKFFNDQGFLYLHSPIITGSDAEGAGEMFRVTTIDPSNPPRKEDGSIDYRKDFFAKETNLTVSGQLEAELGALAFSDVYTFGPTFRAENSNTSRHLAEFWMVEPEIAFAGLKENMDLAEEMLKFIIDYVIQNCEEDLEFLEKRLLDEEKSKPQADRSSMTLREKLQFCLDHDFVRLTYTEAIQILKNSKPNKKKKFQFIIDEWGADLQSEHERYLVEKHFKKPVILTDYPASIKAFYMRLNEDEKTVAAMDILFPGIGEIVGGSVREERYEVLKSKMEANDIPVEEMNWYLDTRRFGTCPHAGYGLGFSRMILFLTGMGNIRDVIPFPRTPGNAGF
ncbi:asparagine--tRNA ligase [Portibacter marinus]|uniref:asparagine--tRNA ligase n=1 Tax=Portibacter marinus TaxID=2898660 RepID=UPI001F431BB9|nr:asparagine--tRNA ligase [Portibacter marinus]